MSYFFNKALETAQESVFDINSDDSWHMLRNIQTLINAVILKAKSNNLLLGEFSSIATKCRQFFDSAELNDTEGTPFEFNNVLMCAALLDLREHKNATLLNWGVWLNYCKKGGKGVMSYAHAKKWANSFSASEETKDAIDYMCKYRSLVCNLIKVMPKSFPHYDEIKAIFKRFLELFSYELFFSLKRY